MSKNCYQLGFTLSELLITISVLAITLAIAVPSFNNFVVNSRLNGMSNALVSAIHLARNESVTRSENVSICPAQNGTFSSCGSNSQWNNGWIVFHDTNANGLIDGPEAIIKVFDALKSGDSLSTATSRITFTETGLVSAGAGTFTIAANKCTSKGHPQISLSTTGGIRTDYLTCS